VKCRHCRSELTLTLVDLGSAPPSNAYLTAATIHAPEKWFPLKVLVCTTCWLVQTDEFAGKLFDENYAYFSSYSTSWLAHASIYAEQMTQRFGLGQHSNVVEVAANDGYLLQYFQARGIPSLGIEPTANTAAAARDKGIEIVEEFFSAAVGRRLEQAGCAADLMAANNVLAHVPDINDFVSGFARMLKPDGVATFEFPHLMRLIAENQFDTIYHEHFSYLSLSAVKSIFERNGLSVFDVEQLETHGGSLRVFAQRTDTDRRPVDAVVAALLKTEQAAGMTDSSYYAGFQPRADKIKHDLLSFLIDTKKQGGTVAGYGAAAKGNTLLNYAGVRPDILPWVVDRNPSKKGKYLPGSRIPIVGEERIRADKPSHVLILPWNLKDEIVGQLAFIRDWGGKFVTAVPSLEVF
jgi:predicted TPR repeat methyltransferase